MIFVRYFLIYERSIKHKFCMYIKLVISLWHKVSDIWVRNKSETYTFTFSINNNYQLKEKLHFQILYQSSVKVIFDLVAQPKNQMLNGLYYSHYYVLHKSSYCEMCCLAASKTFQVEIFQEQYDEIRKWRLLDHPWGMQEYLGVPKRHT